MPPVSIDESGNTLYGVEAIIGSRRKGGVFEYQILWKGYDESNNKSWEPLKNVVNAYGSIKEYEKGYPRRSKPTKDEIERARREEPDEEFVEEDLM